MLKSTGRGYTPRSGLRKSFVRDYTKGHDYRGFVKVPVCSLDGDYSCKSPRLRLADGGRLLQISFSRSASAEWNAEQFFTRGKRSVCKGFSFASRRRMLNHLNSITVSAELPTFVTLTFPDSEFDDSVTVFAKKAKGHLDAWLKRLARVCPGAAGFWRLEWQSRKSGFYEGKLFPHFHLMIWGLEYRHSGWRGPCGQVDTTEAFVRVKDHQLHLDLYNTMVNSVGGYYAKSAEEVDSWAHSVAVRKRERMSICRRGGENLCFVAGRKMEARIEMESAVARGLTDDCKGNGGSMDPDLMSFFDWVSLSWYHVVDSRDGNHFKAGASVERVRSWGGVMCYCSKYMAKLGEFGFLEEVPIGRSWGVFNRSAIPWAKILELDLDEETGNVIRRVMRRYLEHVRGRRIRAPYGLTLYCDTSRFKSLLAREPDAPF